MTTMLTHRQLLNLWDRLWEEAETDDIGRARHTSGIKWMLTDYDVTVTPGAGPHGPARADALARLEALDAIERIGGGRNTRTRAMWVNPPVRSSPAGR